MKEKLEAFLILIGKLKATIADGKSKRVLKLLQEQEDFPDDENQILNLLARWSSNDQQKLEGIISDANFKVERNSITKGLLSFLTETKNKIEAQLEAVLRGDTLPPTTEDWPLPNFGGKPVVLIVYAKEDRQLWQEMKKHLFLLLRDKTLCFVDIHEDLPIGVSDPEVYQEKLVDAANKVLVLVSPNIMAYPAFMLAEKALEQRKLIPIRLEKIELEGTPFSHDIQGLPLDGKFVSEGTNLNSELADIAKHLKLVVERLKPNLS